MIFKKTMFKEKVVNILLNKISDTNKKIRYLEDESKKFSVDPASNRVYTGLVGYREALQDLLSEVRSINENERSGRDI